MKKIKEIKYWFLACAIISFLLWHVSVFGYSDWYIKNINEKVGAIYVFILLISWCIIIARIGARLITTLFQKIYEGLGGK